MEFLHAGENPFDIVHKAKSCELLLNRLRLPEEGMVRTTCGVTEVGEAFEDFVELEEERVGGIAVHLHAAAATLLDVFPAVKDSLLYLIVDHAGDEGVLVLEDVPEDLDEALRAALLQENLKDPVNRHQIEGRNIVGLEKSYFLGRFHAFDGVPSPSPSLSTYQLVLESTYPLTERQTRKPTTHSPIL